jgi:hypothetical protein
MNSLPVYLIGNLIPGGLESGAWGRGGTHELLPLTGIGVSLAAFQHRNPSFRSPKAACKRRKRPARCPPRPSPPATTEPEGRTPHGGASRVRPPRTAAARRPGARLVTEDVEFPAGGGTARPDVQWRPIRSATEDGSASSVRTCMRARQQRKAPIAQLGSLSATPPHLSRCPECGR